MAVAPHCRVGDTDPAAAAFVFGRPDLAIHQFPLETYRRCAYSVAELERDLGHAGRIGRWLWEHFTNPPDWVRVGGVWPLGDSPPVLVTALCRGVSASPLRRLMLAEDPVIPFPATLHS